MFNDSTAMTCSFLSIDRIKWMLRILDCVKYALGEKFVFCFLMGSTLMGFSFHFLCFLSVFLSVIQGVASLIESDTLLSRA